MKILFVGIFLISFCNFAYANIASTAFVQKRVYDLWGIRLGATTGTIASEKYLYSAIDSANLALNGVRTNYSSLNTGGVIATTRGDVLIQSWIKYCAAGTYLPAGGNDCVNCGLGYYCTGGSHRAPCTGGAIGCNNENNASDQMAPGLVNRVLTLDEVNAYMPQTEISQWGQVGPFVLRQILWCELFAIA
ncbi:MAG: hypothetical protein LBF37_03675 [Rickettsiales bacterium]|jgi:hypothetical protein|nr:hypothetical protein [Rickettsiales bacterium]